MPPSSFAAKASEADLSIHSSKNKNGANLSPRRPFSNFYFPNLPSYIPPPTGRILKLKAPPGFFFPRPSDSLFRRTL